MHQFLDFPWPVNWRPGLMGLILFLLAACSSEENALPENPTAADLFRQDPVALERGRALYEGSCASFCHEVEGDEAIDLFDCQWRHGSSDEELFAIITNGIPDTRMVGFGDNFPEREEDTWRLVAYINNDRAHCQSE